MKRISRGVRKQIEREFKPVIEAKDAEIAKLKTAARSHDETVSRIRRERDEIESKVVAFLEREGGLRMQVQKDFNTRGEVYRLVLDIDHQTIRRHLEWGNDYAIIDMMGQHLGRQAARHIASINLGRSERELASIIHPRARYGG